VGPDAVDASRGDGQINNEIKHVSIFAVRRNTANICKKVQKAANSKTVANPTDNEGRNEPPRAFFLQASSSLQTSENPQKIDT